VIYLWNSQESEAGHWVSLVLVPSAAIAVMARLDRPRMSVREALASVGIRRGNLRRGVLLGVALGAAISVVQLLVSNQRDALLVLLGSGKALLYLPLALALLALTAASTEEFFFRGVLQTRLARWWRSDLAALLVTATCFGLYHFPYAYLSPGWPSHGDAAAALDECAWDAAGGALLGLVYWKSGKNLLASIATHTMFDALPAITMLHVGPRAGG
jgi:membrane protease YdiL (CAAX protease family)